MAVPGESECRPVAPCADGTWGDIPVEPDTQFVDAAYGGGASDGSADRPWTSIPMALDAAAPGAIVAVAAGTYPGSLVVQKPVRLWGRCPELVTLNAPSAGQVLLVGLGGSGTVVRSLAVTGDAMGIIVSGATDVELAELWVHHTADRGVNVEASPGGASAARLTDSLIEDAGVVAVLALGAQLDVERVVVRGSHQFSQSTVVRAIYAQFGPQHLERSSLTVTDTVVEDAHWGIQVVDSDAVIERTVVRRGRVPLLDADTLGVWIEHHPEGPGRSTGIIRNTVVQDVPGLDLYVTSSDVTIEDTTVRDNCLGAGGTEGDGVGIMIRNEFGRTDPAVASITFSTVEHCSNQGLSVVNSTTELTGTIVRHATGAPSEESYGSGIIVVSESPMRASMSAHGSLIEANTYWGILAGGSDVALDAVIVRNTGPYGDGTYGDGIMMLEGTLSEYELLDTIVTVTASRIESSTRAGVSNFGAALRVGTTEMECNRIDLDGEIRDGLSFTFDDLGGNTCSCDGDEHECQLVTTGLEPPSQLSQ